MVFGLLSTLPFIQSHGYFIMFLAMLVEGPITTYIASFAASLNLFNIYLIFILAIFGNFLTDIMYYYIGRFGIGSGFRKKYSKYFHNEKLNSHLKRNMGKTILIIKLLPPLPVPGLILTGALNLHLKKFLFYSFFINILMALFFTLFGFYSGILFNTLLRYFKIVGLIMVVLGLFFMFWLVFFKIPKYLAKKYEDVN